MRMHDPSNTIPETRDAPDLAETLAARRTLFGGRPAGRRDHHPSANTSYACGRTKGSKHWHASDRNRTQPARGLLH